MRSASACRAPLVDDAYPEEQQPGQVWTATGREVPVFFDHKGRRRHWVSGGGAVITVAAALWLVGLVGGAVGFGHLPAPLAALRVPRSLALDAGQRHVRLASRHVFADDRDRDVRLDRKL